MATLLTTTAKGRQPRVATLARGAEERMFGSWQAFLGSEARVPCRHGFIGRRNLGITRGLDSRYVPAGGSS